MTTTGGSGGPLTNRTFVNFTDNGITSRYHCYAGSLDWTKQVGILIYMDGSGGYGIDNPTSSYLLGGSTGMIAVARKHNMLLLVPEAPPPGCDNADNCWYNTSTTPNATQKSDWLRALVDYIYTQYNIEKKRVAVGGYSSGAQATTRWFIPRHGAAIMEDGVFVAIAFGGNPYVTGNFPQWFKDAVHGYWNTGTADYDAYVSASYGAIGGYNWYTSNGFNTDYDWPVGVGHGRSGEFGGIMDDQIAVHVPPSGTTTPPPPPPPPPPPSNPKVGAIATASTSASLSVPYPADVDAGDLLIIAVAARADETMIAFTASGWTGIWAQGASFARSGFLYRFATGSESGSVLVSGPGVSKTHKMMAVPGISQTSPLDQTPTVYEGDGVAADTQVVIPGQTPNVTGCVPFWVVTGFLATSTWTPSPSSATEWLDTYAEGGTGRSGAAYTQAALTTTSPTGTRGATPTTAATSSGLFVLLRPEGSGGFEPTQAPVLSLDYSTGGEVRVSCTEVPYAETYEFQRDGVTIQNNSSMSRTDTSLTLEESYAYRVRGVNSYGPGPWSNTLTIVITDGDSFGAGSWVVVGTSSSDGPYFGVGSPVVGGTSSANVTYSSGSELKTITPSASSLSSFLVENSDFRVVNSTFRIVGNP